MIVLSIYSKSRHTIKKYEHFALAVIMLNRFPKENDHSKCFCSAGDYKSS